MLLREEGDQTVHLFESSAVPSIAQLGRGPSRATRNTLQRPEEEGANSPDPKRPPF